MKILRLHLIVLLGAFSSGAYSQDSVTSILPDGAGYYSTFDKSLLAPEQCYFTKADSKESEHGASESILFSSIKTENLSRNTSIDANSEYLKSIERNGRNYSYNMYFEVNKNKFLSLKTNNSATGAESFLSDKGIVFYRTLSADNFDKKCGNYIITNYNLGSYFVASLNIEFNTPEEAEIYRVATLKDNATITSRINSLNDAVIKNSLTGKVTIQAMQLGGNPDEIATMLNKNDDNYFSFRCNLSDINTCKTKSKQVLNYAQNSYLKQFEKDSEKGLVFLRIADNGIMPKYMLGL